MGLEGWQRPEGHREEDGQLRQAGLAGSTHGASGGLSCDKEFPWGQTHPDWTESRKNAKSESQSDNESRYLCRARKNPQNSTLKMLSTINLSKSEKNHNTG